MDEATRKHNLIGTRAIELMRALRQHEADGCDAGTTLFAVFGVNSLQGRFADTFAFNNPPYFLWLEDIASDHGAGDQTLREYSKIGKSEDAQTMFEHRLRSRGRKVLMTEGARNALLNYYLEKIELIIMIADLLEDNDILYDDRKSFIRRHCKSLEKLCRTLMA